MRTERIAVFAAVIAIATVPNTGQGQAGIDVLNPKLSGLKVDATAAWVNGYYDYSYVLSNGPSSTGALLVFQLDVTQSPPFQVGTTPPSSGAGRIFTSATNWWVPPMGLIVPALWNGTITPWGLVTWGIDSRSSDTGQLDITQMAPGKVSPPIGLRCVHPPGFRAFSATPVWHASEPGVVVEREQDVVFHGTTFGPVPRNSEEANQTALMLYRSPTGSVTSLAAGAKAIVIVSFGNVLPATFKAMWNKTDVTSRFAPVAYQFSAVELTPQPGRNVLVISVSGAKSSGGTTTQTDRFAWDAP